MTSNLQIKPAINLSNDPSPHGSSPHGRFSNDSKKEPSSLLKREFHYVFKCLQEQSQIDLFRPQSSKLQSNLNQMKTLIKKNSALKHHDRLINEFFSLGPMESIIHHEDISEIIINGQNCIFYEQNGQLHKLNDYFLSPITFNNFVHRICEEAKMVLNLNQLFTDGNWRGWRVHLIRNPVVNVSFHLSFRKHPKTPWTFSKLRNQGWANDESIFLIKQLIKDKNNLLISGPTSSGKTSVLNACLQCLPANERIITIEDSDELILPNDFSSKLITRSSVQENLTNVDQSELVRQSLRMRPDRIIMGETRSVEAKDLLMALATGHSGSLGTIHAENHKQALWRLEMLIQMGAPSWNTSTVRQMIVLSISHLIVLDRIPQPRQPQHIRRILKGIYKLTGVENTGFLFEPLFVRKINSEFHK